MKTYEFDSFVKSLNKKTVKIHVEDIQYKGFNTSEGSIYIVTIVQILNPLYKFSDSGSNIRIVALYINSSYCDEWELPYIEEVFINAYFRKKIIELS